MLAIINLLSIIDEFSRRNDGACFNSPSDAANMINVLEHFSKSLVRSPSTFWLL